MRQLSDLAERSGMFAADSGEGVRLINNPFSDKGAARTGGLLREEMKRGTLGKDLSTIVDTPYRQQKIPTIYKDYEGLWQAGYGSGKATEKFLKDLDAMPEFAKEIEPALMRKAEINLQRDINAAKKFGLPVRDDVQYARSLLVKGGLNALRSAYNSGAILPAAVSAVLAPSLLSPGAKPQIDSWQKGT